MPTPRRFRAAAAVVVVAALVLTAALLHWIGAYWAFWDLGVNPAANRGTLVFLYAPVVSLSLLAAGFAALAAMRRRGRRVALLAIVGAETVLAVAVFTAEVVRTAPARWDDTPVVDFLRTHGGRLLRGEFEPVRRRAGRRPSPGRARRRRLA